MQKPSSAHQPGAPAPPLTSYTVQLSAAQARELEACLRARQYRPREVPHAAFAYESPQCNVAFYPRKGVLLVQGKGTREFVEFVLEPEILQEARLGYEEVLHPEILLPRIGVDESGKGDFFGPLCAAGVYVNATVARALKSAGVRDSKTIGSDAQMARLAEVIRRTPGCVFTVVPIGNEAYNRLYRQPNLRSVNKILAWAHARVIENLLLQQHQMKPPPVRAIIDQFASEEAVVRDKLMPLGKSVELIQRHKAESDIAVAAASILARDEFVRRLKKLGQPYGMEFPKGASAAVDAVAREFLARFSAEELPKVAKMHFRTAARAQGLPEPPAVDWKKRRG